MEQQPSLTTNDSRKRVIIVGGGFAGLKVARGLKKAPVRVTVVDSENHHLFHPLLYQVATAGLSADEIAVPIRSVLRKQANADVVLGTVVGVDLNERQVELADGIGLPYDYLVLAAGATTDYLGQVEPAVHAYPMKNLRDALRLREKVLMSFEAADREPDETRRRRLLTFVVVGGGPTGVELAGALAELGRDAMARDFRRISAPDVRVILLEMTDRLLPPFDESLSAKAQAQLEELRVDVRLRTRVESISERGVRTNEGDIEAATVCWAPGVRPVNLAEALDLPLDDRGRIRTDPDCSVVGHTNVFAIGDMARVADESGSPLPQLAAVAQQEGAHVARCIRHSIVGLERPGFRYRDRGILATIGRSRAVAQAGRLHLSGFVAWFAWIVIHVALLIGFRNRLLVLVNWFWSYLTFKRGARLITRQHLRDYDLRQMRASLRSLRGAG